MKVTVLGCWAPYPRPGEACSGYLMRCGSTNLLLEAGSGSFAQLTRHVDFRSLAGVVVTHFHPDHYVDLYCLRHAIEGARRDGGMQEPVTLLVPPEPVEIFKKLAGYSGAFNVINVETLPATRNLPGTNAKMFRLGDLDLHFISTLHSLPGYAVLARGDGKTLLFSGDSAPFVALEQAARSADLFICESSGLNKDADQLAGIHMTAGQAGALAARAGAKQLVLTHFWPGYDTDELAVQAGETFGGGVEIAAQGKEFIL